VEFNDVVVDESLAVSGEWAGNEGVGGAFGLAEWFDLSNCFPGTLVDLPDGARNAGNVQITVREGGMEYGFPT